MSQDTVLRESLAEKVAGDAPPTVKAVIDRLAESEEDVDVRRTRLDPVVYVRGRLVAAWLEL